jgi:hypothetical protein
MGTSISNPNIWLGSESGFFIGLVQNTADQSREHFFSREIQEEGRGAVGRGAVGSPLGAVGRVERGEKM